MSEPVRPWHYLTQQHTTDEVAAKRLDTCKQCPKYITLTTQCGVCKCFMPFKTKVENATCPEGKW